MTRPAFDRVLALTRIPAFAGLLPEDLASLAERLEEHTLAPHETGPDDSDGGGAVCLLHTGALEIAGGRNAEAPALVGVVEALGGEPSTLRAGSAGARLSTLTRDELAWVMTDVYEVWLAVLRHVAERWLAAEPLLADAPRVVRPRPDDVPASLVTRILLLSELDLFGSLRARTVGRLARSLEELAFRPGDALWEGGGPAQECFFVLDGAFEAEEPAGRGAPLGGRGAVLGLREALAGAARSGGVTASGEARALRLTCEALIDELEDDPKGAASLLEALAQRVLRAEAASRSEPS